jgi:hypothetical protein
LNILILDLYLYGIKIQINAKKNSIENTRENHRFFKINFFKDFFFNWVGAVRVRKLKQTGERLSTVHMQREQ